LVKPAHPLGDILHGVLQEVSRTPRLEKERDAFELGETRFLAIILNAN
jgi:hypothetical protein